MTAMQAAFEAAGYVKSDEPFDRVIALMRSALRGDLAAKEPIDEYVAKVKLRKMAKQNAAQSGNWDEQRRAFISAVQNDAELLWAMFEPWKNQAITLVLSKANAEIHAEKKAADQRSAVARTQNARISVPVQTASECHYRHDRHAHSHEIGGQDGVENQPSNAPEPHARAVQDKFGNPWSNARPSAARNPRDVLLTREVARKSLLDSYKINGQPIGDMTPREANGWADARALDARFVRLLTANLPPHLPIRQFRRADEVDAIMKQAREMGDG